MRVYRIAEMNIAVEAIYEKTYDYLSDYLTDSADYELYIAPTEEMIRYEAELGEEIHGIPQTPYICEAVSILRVICDYIIHKGGFFLHCSCLMYRGEAIIFTAPSGTGKSTHAALWRKYLGNEVAMINDDKPLVRERDGRFFIYGTPWRGKHGIGANISAPIRAIVFLYQAPENKAEKLDPISALSLILQQTVIPSNKNDLSLLLDILGSLLESVQLFRLGCTISEEAVTTIRDAIFPENV